MQVYFYFRKNFLIYDYVFFPICRFLLCRSYLGMCRVYLVSFSIIVLLINFLFFHFFCKFALFLSSLPLCFLQCPFSLCVPPIFIFITALILLFCLLLSWDISAFISTPSLFSTFISWGLLFHVVILVQRGNSHSAFQICEKTFSQNFQLMDGIVVNKFSALWVLHHFRFNDR